MTSVVSAKNEPEAATFEGRGRGLAPRRRPALGGQPGLGVTVAVLLPPWRAGCHRRWGRERCWVGSREGGPPQRPLASGGGLWSGGREKEPHTQQRSRRRRGRASPTAWGRNSHREARGGGGEGWVVRDPGSASHGGSAGGSTVIRPGAELCKPESWEGRGAGGGAEGPGGGGGNDPRRVLTRSSRVSAGRGPCGGPLGSCGSGGRSQGPGTRAGGPAGGHGVSSRAGTGRSWAIGTWGGRLAGWSSGHCRWSRGEAGSWRGIWLSCWTCMRAVGTRAR